VRKPSRNLPVASKTSVLAAEKTGQVLVRTGPHPGRTESPVISGKEVGYVRRSEFTLARMRLRILSVAISKFLRKA
jgi:hypothetical protein